ncbi:5892_t:CDS:2, partial [Gigaspora margarita]
LEKGDHEIRKLQKAIKDINRVFQKLRKKEELIDPRDKEDLKMIQELYQTNLNIQLGTIDEDINKENLTKLCIEKCKLSKAIERKPIWFDKIEQKLLEGPDSQKIKTEWRQNMTNTLAPRLELLKISIDKRKK